VSWDGSDIVERNYTNAPGTDQRGLGAALTYYRVEEGDNFIFMPGYSLRILYTIEEKKKADIRLFLEYGTGFAKVPVAIETGWDRFDELETYKNYDLTGRLAYHCIKFGWQYDSHDNVPGSVYIGISIPGKNEGDISLSNRVALTIGGNIKFYSKAKKPQ
jgi:hypothetical protein